MENQENQPMGVVSKPTTHNASVKAGVVVLIVVLTFFAGYKMGNKGFVFSPKEFKVINQNETAATVDYNLLWKAIELVNERYIERPIDQQKILYGAVKGAVEAVGDPYTTFFEPKELTNFQTDLRGSFGGIGAEVGKKDNAIVIIAPLKDSPAQKAGILAKDIVVSVDGQSTAGWSVEEAVEKIRGEKGTTVTLSLFRDGKDRPFDVKIVRDEIKLQSVKWEFKEVGEGANKKTIAIISMSRFGDDTNTLFGQAVNEILKKNVSGIVLDLRNNPGGYLQTAVDVASEWLNKGELVVAEAHSDGRTENYNSKGNARLAPIRTLVLINGGSASASEILAGALSDHKIAQLVGEKSFGKGSVQELDNLPGGSAVKITIAKWITPSGKNLNHDGLQPNIEIKLTEQDITDGKDLQMEKALEEISN